MFTIQHKSTSLSTDFAVFRCLFAGPNPHLALVLIQHMQQGCLSDETSPFPPRRRDIHFSSRQQWVYEQRQRGHRALIVSVAYILVSCAQLTDIVYLQRIFVSYAQHWTGAIEGSIYNIWYIVKPLWKWSLKGWHTQYHDVRTVYMSFRQRS